MQAYTHANELNAAPRRDLIVWLSQSNGAWLENFPTTLLQFFFPDERDAYDRGLLCTTRRVGGVAPGRWKRSMRQLESHSLAHPN